MGRRCPAGAPGARRVLARIMFGIWMFVPGQAPAEQLFVAHRIAIEGEIKEVKAADLDGDGRRELILSATVRPQGLPERRLHRCGWIEAGGRTRPVLQETWEVPPEAVFWDTGPTVGAGAGRLLCFLTRDGLHGLVPEGNSDLGSRLGIEAPALVSVGQEDEFRWLDVMRDWDGDGRQEAMLPMGREARFYRWEGAGWVLSDSVRISPLAYYSNGEAFGRELGGYAYMSVLLYPVLEAADLNGDGRRDLLALRNGKGLAYLREEGGRLASDPIAWDLEIRSPGERAKRRATLTYRVADLNRDGCADVVVHKVSVNVAMWDAETAIFLGGPGRPGSGPHQRIASRGLLSGVSLDDLDGDGYQDLTVWSVKMGLLPLVEILLRRVIHLRFHAYYGSWPGGFPSDAQAEGDFTLRIDSSRPDFIRGLVPSTRGDFNQDRIKDLVAAKGEDRLAIHLGLAGRRFDSRPWAVLEAPGVNYVGAEDLDGDGRCDLFGYQVQEGASLVHVWLQARAGQP